MTTRDHQYFLLRQGPVSREKIGVNELCQTMLVRNLEFNLKVHSFTVRHGTFNCSVTLKFDCSADV
jgi:hypothetical protein